MTYGTDARPPVGSVREYTEGDSYTHLVVVTDHPGVYPELVLIATEDGLLSGRRTLAAPTGLTDPDPSRSWDVDVLQALAIAAPRPHPQH